MADVESGEANIWNPRTLLQLSADTLRIEESQLATEGQSLFNLTTFAYSLGVGSLAVYKNGVFQKLGIDWNEQTEQSFTLIVPASAGDYVSAVGFVGMTNVGGGGLTLNPIFDSVTWNHLTDVAGKKQYRAQYRDFVGSPVFFLEPISINPGEGAINDRSVLVGTYDGVTDELHYFDFSRNGFFAAPSFQAIGKDLPSELVELNLVDKAGQITVTFAPVEETKTHRYEFTTDSTVGSEIYAGFNPNGTGYGSDPVALNDFITLDYYNNNTPGVSQFVLLTNLTTAEQVIINYDEVLGVNSVQMFPVDPNKQTFYNFQCDSTVGSELYITFTQDGRVKGADPTELTDFVTLDYYNNNLPSTAVFWGDIGGTLSNQTDLDTQLTNLQNQITVLQAASPAGWQKAFAMIEYNISVGGSTIGTARNCSASIVNTDDIRITLDNPVTNVDNMKIVFGHQDAIIAPVEMSYIKQSTTVVDVLGKNTITGASGSAVTTIVIYDAGLV